MTTTYFVKLEQFEGPLDLLLHLIRLHELDIFKVDLYVLTSQYLEYLRLIKFKDLKDAAAFMEMAAALIEIKSRYLLPSAEHKAGDDDLDEEEDDPALSLQKRLLAYDTFRRAAEYLQDMPQFGLQLRTGQEWQRLEPQYSHIEAPLRGDRNTLLILYEQMLSTLADRRPVTVKAVTESVTVEEVIGKLKTYIDKLRFGMFQNMYGKISSRYELVAYILGMLQLVRDRELKIYQEELCGPIWMYRKDLEHTELQGEWQAILGEQADGGLLPPLAGQEEAALPISGELAHSPPAPSLT